MGVGGIGSKSCEAEEFLVGVTLHVPRDGAKKQLVICSAFPFLVLSSEDGVHRC